MHIEAADFVRLMIWPGILHVVGRMAWHSMRPYQSQTVIAARMAIAALLLSRAFVMAQNWGAPLAFVPTISTLVALILVLRAPEL